MRRKPFFVVSATSLFVALTVTAMGLGWGEGAEDRPTFTHIRPLSLAPDSSVSDPQGDVLELRLLRPFPYPGRDLTIEGNTAKVLIPRWVIGDPYSFQWMATTIRPMGQALLDYAPDYQFLSWSRGLPSEAPDAQNPGLLPHEDLTYVRLREVDSSRLEFLWRCRGDIPVNPVDINWSALIGLKPLGGPDYMVVLGPTDAGWMWSVSAPGTKRFSWNSTRYEDILSAIGFQTGDGQLTFEMTTAQDIPAVPADEDGHPWFTWMLDVDRDQASGDPNDVNVVVRWNPESNAWEGALRGWNGERYEDLQAAVAFARTGATVSAVVQVADLGLTGGFLWRAQTSINVGLEEELFFALADNAPDSGWVEEVLAPAQTPTPTVTATATVTAMPPGRRPIYLPVITRGVVS